METIYFILAAIFIFNLVLFFFRSSKARNYAKKATDGRIMAEKQLENVKRRIEYEQECAARRIELQNKTFELYEQVRRSAGVKDGDSLDTDGETSRDE